MINAEQRNGNLFVQLTGSLCRDKVETLTTTLTDNYSGTGNIFINTEKITEILPSSAGTLDSLLKQSSLPDERIYLIGEMGFKLSNKKIRVITRPPKKSRCAGCKKVTLRSKESLYKTNSSV